MTKLAARSYKKELLDDPAIPFADIPQNMKELNTINTYLGGHAISISGIKKILKRHKLQEAITICEIGCGGGDNLKAIERWCKKNKIEVSFVGIDIQPACIEFAQLKYPALKSKWICSDYKIVDLRHNKPDIIFSSLFCHHFSNEELILMLQWMRENVSKGFFINDLHRHLLAWYAIRLITGIFSRSRLVKNDAPLSVARGFKMVEWKKLLAQAGISNFTIEWKWAFRHLIIYYNGRIK